MFWCLFAKVGVSVFCFMPRILGGEWAKIGVFKEKCTKK